MPEPLNVKEGVEVALDFLRRGLKANGGAIFLVGGEYDTNKKNIVTAVAQRLKNAQVTTIHQCDYLMKAKGKRVEEDPKYINWDKLVKDVLKLKKGEAVTKPKYNPALHALSGEETIQGRVVIVWGVFALHEKLLPISDVSVYCESDKFVRMTRYFITEAKNLSPDVIVSSLLSGDRTNKNLVKPSKKLARYVILDNSQPSFSGKHSRKLVDSLRVSGKVEMEVFLKSGQAKKGENRIQEEYYIFSKDKAQVVRLRKDAIAFKSKDDKEAAEVWYEFKVAEQLIKKLIEMYASESLKVSKARTIYKLVGSDFRVYIDQRVEIGRGKVTKEIADFSGVIRSRTSRQGKAQSIVPVIEMLGLTNEPSVSPYYEMMVGV